MYFKILDTLVTYWYIIGLSNFYRRRISNFYIRHRLILQQGEYTVKVLYVYVLIINWYY